MLKKQVQYICLLIFFVSLFSCQLSFINKSRSSAMSQNEIQGNSKAILSMEKSTDKLIFTLKNMGDSSIFLAYSRSKSISEEKIFDFVPYNLQCKEKGKENVDYGPNFHFAPKLSPLELNEKIEFTVNEPDIIGECIISVMFYDNEDIAELINHKNPFLTDVERRKVDNFQRSVKFSFTNK